MIEKRAETEVPINELLANRWSGRAFDVTRDISQDQFMGLFEAIRWSPSCYGDQPWRYIVCGKATNKDSWQMAFECLAEGNQTWAQHAPVLLLAIADTVLSQNGKPNRWGQYDTGAASMSLCVQATELGLMVHQMGGFNADKAKELFEIPEQYIPMAMIAIGYQLAMEEIPEEQKERELAERARRPLLDSIFDGKWGLGFSKG